jgi:hypothetical protein
MRWVSGFTSACCPMFKPVYRTWQDYPSDQFLCSLEGARERWATSCHSTVCLYGDTARFSMIPTPCYRSSTLENWCREFARFVPSISIQTYYAGKEERPVLRQTLIDTQRRHGKNDNGWEVLITTYNLAQGDDKDRKFFRRIEWDVSNNH